MHMMVIHVCMSIALICLSSCGKEHQGTDKEFMGFLKQADSLNFANQQGAALAILEAIRPILPKLPAVQSEYYQLAADASRHDLGQMNLYADSALTCIEMHTDGRPKTKVYLAALIKNGEVKFLRKQYREALRYYELARQVSGIESCNDGSVAGKIAGIYFDQKNYSQAATYWSESYRLLESCQENESREKLFSQKHTALIHTGLAYQLAGNLDSARHYYQMDLKFIKSVSAASVDWEFIAPALISLYDHMGGLELDAKRYELADSLLKASVNVEVAEPNAIKVPPLLKLANLYLNTNQQEKAAAVFRSSEILLNRHPSADLASRLSWYNLYSRYSYKYGYPADAYRYLGKFIRLKDSLDLSSSSLLKLDIDREFKSINQQQMLEKLAQANWLKKVYIIVAALMVAFAIVIILFIYRSLKRNRRNQEEIHLKNVQLEKLNKNNIKIMRIMAHDLRNPLAGITGLADIILIDDPALTEDTRHMVTLIKNTGTNSLEMINELLDSGLAENEDILITEVQDAEEILCDCVELLRFKAADKQQQIKYTRNKLPTYAHLNYPKIWRAFNNIIVNAIKFSYPDSTIRIEVKTSADDLLISIADSGVGIPEKDRERVFDMFSAAKKTGTNGEVPFGLGLSISKSIIEKHNGKIWFESQPGVGTTFFIRLPLAKKH